MHKRLKKQLWYSFLFFVALGYCLTPFSGYATNQIYAENSLSDIQTTDGLKSSYFVPWAQGFFQKAHNSQNIGFDSYAKGMVYGVDAQINENWLVRLGYTRSHVKTQEVTQKTISNGDNYFLQVKYQPQKWYVQTSVNYGHRKNKYRSDDFMAHNRLDTYAAEFLSGYHFGIAHNYSGIRYHYSKPSAYISNSERFDVKNTQILTATIGTEVSKQIKQNSYMYWQPAFRLSGSYDFISDNSAATVFVPNAYTSFNVDTYRLHRASLQTGIGLATQIGQLRLSVDYDLDWRVSHLTQTGLIKIQYTF